ncbi:MCP methyltransferase/methylesterase [Nitzschia inconspicua]|uniref:MCP methyltransferase/methylesterase n=1 Tax=Nitzschia inconspicua TaxID=303405 RepID=A0A9K3Q1S6_9STRA|nr:MCP methyltransferase/methylesterase [Nitzschia inconspicua]
MSRRSYSTNGQTTPDVETCNRADPGDLPLTSFKKTRSSSSSRVSFQTPPHTRADNYPHDVSPADTFDTVLTSPSTRSFDDASFVSSSPQPAAQKLVIDHNINTSSSTDGSSSFSKRNTGNGQHSRAAATLFVGLSKPLMGVGLLLLLGAGGMAAWGWLFQIPGLENQVKALEEQVLRLNTEIDRLTGQVDRLEDENDRYQELNNDLNRTVVELEDVKNDLEDVAVDLNTTNQELAQQVNELGSQNSVYVALNKELNNTVVQLSAEVDYFKVALADLAHENGVLSNMTDSLAMLTAQFTNTSVAQNETLSALQEFLQNLMEQNDRLEAFNGNLLTLVNFLNETSTGLGTSLEEITTFLSDQISINQRLALLSLENTYLQRVQTWDCDFRDVFRDQSFGLDYTVPIDIQTQLPAVLDYVDQRVLSKICLDKDDFTSYLNAEYAGGVITTNRLVRAVVLYWGMAFDYFFPDPGEQGVTLEDWAQSAFNCERLPEAFTWFPSRQQRS